MRQQENPIIMKKIIGIVMLFFATAILSGQVQAQPRHAKHHPVKPVKWKRGGYYYYPSANVYYSPVLHRYWYPRNGIWVNATILPPSIVVYKQPAYIVYRNVDDDIWRDNRIHYRRYYHPAPVYIPPVVSRRPGVSVRVEARF
jgi:hypothetical protein